MSDNTEKKVVKGGVKNIKHTCSLCLQSFPELQGSCCVLTIYRVRSTLIRTYNEKLSYRKREQWDYYMKPLNPKSLGLWYRETKICTFCSQFIPFDEESLKLQIQPKDHFFKEANNDIMERKKTQTYYEEDEKYKNKKKRINELISPKTRLKKQPWTRREVCCVIEKSFNDRNKIAPFTLKETLKPAWYFLASKIQPIPSKNERDSNDDSVVSFR